MEPDEKSIPAIWELRVMRQWVAWRYQPRESGKPGKLPIDPATGRAADMSDSATWGTFLDAMHRQHQDNLPGLGFVLTADDPYVVVDLDNCCNAGLVTPAAMTIVEYLDSYTEFSPSGTGLHVWCKGTLPPGKRNAKPVEMYDAAHYLTVTLDHLPPKKPIQARQAEISVVYDAFLAQPATERPVPVSIAPTAEDGELLGRIVRSRVGDRFKRLFEGDASGYGSASEADLALAGYLSFWTQDANQVDRIFRQSGLFRPDKWDAKRGDYSYGAMTVRRAIDNRAGTYDPNWRRA